jgi:CHAT domain-containing protein
VLDGETIQFTVTKKTGDNKTLSPFYWAAFSLSGDWR